jgi:hypothetical protein
MSRAGRIATVLAALGTLLLASAGVSCGGPGDQAGRVARDSREDGLFHDFLDGKYDGAGHPIGATVLEAETDCQPETGAAEAEGWVAKSSRHRAGALCQRTVEDLGAGMFTVNVRALVPTRSATDRTTVFTVRVRDQAGGVVAERDVPLSEFLTALTYQNVPLRFTRDAPTPVVVEVAWPAKRTVRLDYVEVFRSSRQLILTPASGELAAGALLQLELTDPPTGVSFRALCGETDRTDALAALLADGTATQTTTDFRTFVTVPAKAHAGGASR